MGVYKEWITEEKLLIIEQWAIDGLTDSQIAENIGIRKETFCRWKKQFPQLYQSIKRGRAIADYHVENALYQSALGGNTTAQIFWLKNRRPEVWNRKPGQYAADSKKIDELINAVKGV